MKLKDITPEAFACGNCGCGCPAVFETENNSYVIIGKKLSASALEQLTGRIADDEFAIEVSKGMIDGVK
jgi:hypothetical protein